MKGRPPLTMLIGMNELAAHTSEVLRNLSSSDGFLVTRRNTDVLAAITPAGGTRHATEVPVRRLSRETYAVIDEVRKSGEAATVTNRGAPVADIRPVGEDDARRFAAAVAAQSREFMDSLREADRDLAAGRAVTLDDELIESLRPASRARAQRTTRRRKKQGVNPRTGTAADTRVAATASRRKTAQRKPTKRKSAARKQLRTA